MYDLYSIDENTYTLQDEMMAKRAVELLNKHYPGYRWAVNVNSLATGGVMIIKNFTVSYRYGYTLHLDKLDAKFKKVKMAGGEILERANLARGQNEGWDPEYIDGVLDKHQPQRVIH